MIHEWSMTPADQRHAELLARWFRLHTEAAAARTGRKLRQIRAELAEVDAQIADLEAQIAAERPQRGNEQYARR